MSDVVDALYPQVTPLDPVAKAWLNAVTGHECQTDDCGALICTLAYACMIQVRHNFMSNHIVSHIFRYMYILNPNETLVAHALNAITTSQVTKLRWVPITRDFSSNIDHVEARAAMRAFYRGMKDIPVSHEASTGM